MTSPLLIDIPEQLDTTRLTLHRPGPGDGQRVHEAVRDSLPELRAWGASLPWAMFEPSTVASETFCREAHAAFIQRTMLTYLIVRRRDGLLVGCCSLQSVDWTVRKFEVGYWCRSSARGQGVVTEAVSALLALAFDTLGARRVWCLTDAANGASRRVCEKAGMTLEGVLRHERLGVQGEPRDSCVYASCR